MEKKYTLAIEKQSGIIGGSWEKNLSEVKDKLDIICDGYFTEEEIDKKFQDEIRKQVKERNEKQISWRGIKLYDENGKQIKQEG